MIRFLIEMDSFCVFSASYAVRASRPDFLPADELGFPFPGYVYCYPGKANYLGGDIISGMIAAGITEKEDICVSLDIGINGELVVGNKDFLLCGAGAAGPALEGGSVKTGMRAHEGAVQYVKLQGQEFLLDVIGGGEPKGLCGSGIVDLIGEFQVAGAFGTYLDKESAVSIGLYPDMDRTRLISAGNTSLKGAYEMLLHREKLTQVDKILDQMEYVQLGEVEDFIHLMGAARALPHTEMSRYPSVRKN